ncbi:hypothetical protein IV47_GL001550 [Lactobacillus delbrueckii subsp. bulgaricus ATCC 11842 = JCM 1002]|nr:hypothetical protein IV47_GL001550 [Lactobacillus delbrueckii subsp. bulgaricus ATCC 11842 = JCM 1002]OAL42101.1 Alcohol dehydrogenase Acetaldehyde dehydrogenase [Lactobacillus delbrueckii subsp. bulgaricus]
MVEDKDTKNRFATENVYNSIKHEKTVSIIERNQVEGYIKVAAPLGVLAGIVPTTNPTSTTMFKILVALKTRNAIIFSFHPKAQKCSIHAAQILYDAALKAGAPKNIIQWIHKASLEKHHCLDPQPKDRFYFWQLVVPAWCTPRCSLATRQWGSGPATVLFTSTTPPFWTGLLKTYFCPSVLTTAWFARLKTQP